MGAYTFSSQVWFWGKWLKPRRLENQYTPCPILILLFSIQNDLQSCRRQESNFNFPIRQYHGRSRSNAKLTGQLKLIGYRVFTAVFLIKLTLHCQCHILSWVTWAKNRSCLVIRRRVQSGPGQHHVIHGDAEFVVCRHERMETSTTSTVNISEYGNCMVFIVGCGKTKIHVRGELWTWTPCMRNFTHIASHQRLRQSQLAEVSLHAIVRAFSIVSHGHWIHSNASPIAAGMAWI